MKMFLCNILDYCKTIVTFMAFQESILGSLQADLVYIYITPINTNCPVYPFFAPFSSTNTTHTTEPTQLYMSVHMVHEMMTV